ncbi:hypothetical protein FB107DRAFT_269615 [Schizophyllum commune]
MAFRLTFVLRGLGRQHPSIRFSTFRHGSSSSSSSKQWTRYPSFFIPAPVRRYSLLKTALWVVPLTTGLALHFAPRPKSTVPNFFASPGLIPCRPANELPDVPPRRRKREILKERVLRFWLEYIWEPILTAKRFVYLCCLFVPVIVTSPMLLVGDPDKKLMDERWGAVWWYDLLVYMMEAAGPTFIKLAQWAASRRDLFPVLLCERMGSMHSNAHPHPMSHTVAEIEAVFDRPFDEIFEEFDETPIGAGAIAQVYRATLKNGLVPPSYIARRRQAKTAPVAAITPVIPPSVLPIEDDLPVAPATAVAIKVLHPRVEKTITRDLTIMTFFANIINWLPGMEWISLPEEVQVFGGMMFQQIDLRHEADNLLTFENNFAPRNLSVSFPRPLSEWSTRELLVEEYVKAIPLETFLKNGGGPFDAILATSGLDTFLNMLLLDNFVHSDLHPGNIMVRFNKPLSGRTLMVNAFNRLLRQYFPSLAPPHPIAAVEPNADSDRIVNQLRSVAGSPREWHAALNDLSTEGYIPELIFLDAGLVTTLNAKNRQNFLDLFRAVAEFDGYRTGQLMIERCRTPHLAIDPETFALKMQHIVLSVKRKTFSLGQIKISDILTEVLKAVRQHHVKMEGDFVNTVISILLLEGIGRQLNPELDLFKGALPILRQLGGQMARADGPGLSTRDLPSSNLAALLKVWVWLEAREFISSAIVNADEMIKYDWLTPNA